MDMKIFYVAALFLGGWLWSYVFIRQIMFNFITAYPLIKKMNALQENLIAVGAKRYTTISTLVCSVFSLILLAVVIRFCPLYLAISFAAGAVIAFIMLIKMVSPRNRAMFDSFCTAYCRFVPDDELRTAMFNKKPGQIKQRLYNMNLSRDMVPEFKKEENN